MPRIISKADELVNRNRYLEGRVTYMFNELIEIKQYAEIGDTKSILLVLSKYDLSKKLEF